jgi:hypothetical protein
MMSTKRLIALLTIAACSAIAVPGQPPVSLRAKREENPIERRLCDPQERDCSAFYDLLSDDDVWDVVYLSLPALDLTGGVAFLKEDGEYQRYSIVPKTLKLKDILDGIVAVEPRYRWEIEDGAVNLMPVEEYKMLNVRISEFKMESATILEMLEALKQNPEFKRGLAELKLYEPPPATDDAGGFVFIIGGGKPVEPKKRFSVYRRGATVRQLLNEIVHSEGDAIWSYRERQSTEVTEPSKRYFELGLMRFSY